MGAGINTTTPPPTGDAFTQLLEAVKEMTAELRENNRLRKKESKPWLTAEEAAQLLGINVTSGNYHLRVLKLLRDNGYLTNFTGARSIKYDRLEVLALLERERKDTGYFIPRRVPK